MRLDARAILQLRLRCCSGDCCIYTRFPRRCTHKSLKLVWEKLDRGKMPHNDAVERKIPKRQVHLCFFILYKAFKKRTNNEKNIIKNFFNKSYKGDSFNYFNEMKKKNIRTHTKSSRAFSCAPPHEVPHLSRIVSIGL